MCSSVTFLRSPAMPVPLRITIFSQVGTVTHWKNSDSIQPERETVYHLRDGENKKTKLGIKDYRIAKVSKTFQILRYYQPECTISFFRGAYSDTEVCVKSLEQARVSPVTCALYRADLFR